MVNIMMGPEGSGKTKLLINAINNSVKHETGSMVCIENGNALRFDVDHRVRLIDASEYASGSYTFLRGFLSGLHAGNFDITNVFIDNLYKTIGQDQAANEAFVDWVADFAKENNMEITMTISADPAAASEGMKKYL